MEGETKDECELECMHKCWNCMSCAFLYFYTKMNDGGDGGGGGGGRVCSFYT